MNAKLLLNKLAKQVGWIPVAIGLAVGVAGCAGDRYERSTGESIDDRSTSSRVRSALSGDNTYKYSDVKVTTFKGQVQLSGFVDTKEQKSKAEELAQHAAGVKGVENKITVKP